MNEIRFYRAVGPYGFLSNLYKMPVGFALDAEYLPDGDLFRAPHFFKTSEEAYQYGKPKTQEIADWIVSAPKPHLCAAAAHALFVFDIRPDWATVKIDRMRLVLRHKFDVHKQFELWRALMDTGDAQLVEESNTDAFWGIGKKGTGKNMLGVLLMELRAEMRTAEDKRLAEKGGGK